jgi:hypothetical protein
MQEISAWEGLKLCNETKVLLESVSQCEHMKTNAKDFSMGRAKTIQRNKGTARRMYFLCLILCDYSFKFISHLYLITGYGLEGRGVGARVPVWVRYCRVFPW